MFPCFHIQISKSYD
jgi:hypothetical protein